MTATTSPRAGTEVRSRLAILSGLLALSPWCLDCVRLLDQGLRVALKPYPTCITEVAILDGTRCVSEGRPLYPPVGTLPFVFHLYNPLTYLGAGVRVFCMKVRRYFDERRTPPS